MSGESSYTLRFSKAFYRSLKKLPIEVVVEIAMDMAQLKKTAHPPNSEWITGKNNQKRLRTGDYRTVYEIGASGRDIDVLDVGDRKEIYKH